MHRLPELSRWRNILFLNKSCLTVQTENSALLGLVSLPRPSPEPLPSHRFPPALPLPLRPGVLSASPPKAQLPGTEGWCHTDPVPKLPVPSLSPPCISPGKKGGLAQGWGITGDFPVLSQPSITPLFLSLHGGLISHLCWGWKTFFLLRLAPMPDHEPSPTLHAQWPVPPTPF